MRFTKTSILLGLLISTAACSKGGNLVLEPGGRQPINKGSPFLRVNQGGKALLTGAGGVTGSVSVQPSSAQNLNGAAGVTGVINKVTK